MLICAIYDYKSKTYGLPLVYEHEVDATRSIAAAVLDRKSNISRYPNDYAMYLLGHLDQSTGRLTSLDQPQHISNASDHVSTIPIEDALLHSFTEIQSNLQSNLQYLNKIVANLSQTEYNKSLEQKEIPSGVLPKKKGWF